MDDAGDQTSTGISDLIDRALESEWYELPGSEVDHAAYALCQLRRADADASDPTRRGDEAVRAALAEASHPALVWLTSRMISYMDESGFPEAVERTFANDPDAPT